MDGNNNFTTTNVKKETDVEKKSSCYKCPYKSWVYGRKCFPCTRHLLGHYIPELEERQSK